MKLLATVLAGTALVALTGCNRAAQPANNSTDNAVANVAENSAAAPAAPGDSGGKPAADDSASGGDTNATGGGKPTEGEPAIEEMTANSGEGGK